MDFRILGRLEAHDGERDVLPRRAQTRAALAILLLHADERLTTERLIEELWGGDPPPTADKALQGHVSSLRKALGADRIRTERGGYSLRLEPGELDLDRFRAALARARATSEPERRGQLLADALALWRGEPLADLADERFALAAIARLGDLRLAALEERAAASLELGRHAEVVEELERLVERHPLHEGLLAKLMVALYRGGRQSDALRVYRQGRRRLAEELGIDPGSELQLLERQILAQDPALTFRAAPAPGRQARQERKVVTVLVAEVVPASPTDLEDLQGLVEPAVAQVRAVVERHGGTAEPLFANAVLGLFGAPRTHDDDTLRAVRASLEVAASAEGSPVRIRGGIETGEALVTIDADGHVAVTGEVLASASNLQATARLSSIVVGPVARRSTDGAVEYRELRPGAWSPVAVRRPDRAPAHDAPFIGRAAELGLLAQVFARARDERSVQLVTLTAEPGGGKSRLVRELQASLETTDEPPTWRQGRCLPYGDGITYWALGEIVKAEAGILESDDAETSRRKIAAAVAALEPDESRRTWFEGSLSALLGIEGATATGDREQAFAVWQQFLEAAAGRGPLVVVFEDVHWADAALLEFIDHLVRQASGVPLLVLCTARLELLAEHPGWGAGIRNATMLALSPLSPADTARLLSALLGRDADPTTVRRASGNPLFAHELAWMTWRTDDDERPEIPDSLHAVIAARLDTLSPELKDVASDAAVVGEVFWSGALAAMAELERRELEARLQQLVANDVVRRRRSTSVARQTEYEFLHVLVRDVAYGQIPRRDRIDRHRAAAAWIEGLAGDRPTRHAELVAHHYVQALELADRLGDLTRAADLRPLAGRFLALAGDGARPLDVAQAETFYRRALELTGAEDVAHARLLARLGQVTQFTGRLDEAEALTRASIAELDAHGDRAGAAAAMITLVWILWRLGRAEEERRDVVVEAMRILESADEGIELILAYSQMASAELYAGRAAACLEWSTRAVGVADRLGATSLKCDPLHLLGIARFEMGDLGGIDDVRSAVRLGREAGLGWETGTAMSDLAATLWLSESPAGGLAAKRDAAAFDLDRGLTYLEKTTRAESLWPQFDAGEWDALIESADELVAWERERGSGRVTMIALGVKARVLIARGDTRGAAALEAEFLQRARTMGDSQDMVPALSTAAAIRSAAGDGSAALDLLAELAEETRDRDPSKRAHNLPLTTRIAVAWGAADLAREMVPAGKPNYLRSRLCIAASQAILTESDGDVESASREYDAAARGWAGYGCPEEQAYALVGAGRCLAALGRPDEAEKRLREGRAIGESLGARPLVEEARRVAALVS